MANETRDPREPEAFKVSASAANDPSRALEDFRCVRGRILLLTIRYLPYVLLLGSAADILRSGMAHILYVSWILAVAASLIIFNKLANEIPEALSSLWQRRIIAPKGAGPGPVDAPPEEGTLDAPALEAGYARFVRAFDARLNHGAYQSISGIFFFLLLFLSRPVYEFSRWLHPDFGPMLVYEAGGLYALSEGLRLYLNEYVIKLSMQDLPAFMSSMTIEPLLGLIIGLVAWRMFATGAEIRRLGREFDLRPQIMHPDGCGGLGALGTVCLYNASIISVWGIFLGGWIILGPLSPEGSFYTPLFTRLLPLPMAAAVICFFLPLWDIHRVMASKGLVAQRYLRPLEEQLDLMAGGVLAHPAGTSVEEKERLAKGIELMKQFHEKVSNYPEWPFNREMLMILITSQAIQILSLVGLGTSIASNMQAVMELFGLK